MTRPSASTSWRSVCWEASNPVRKGRADPLLGADKALALLRITVDVDVMCVSGEAQMVKARCRR